MAQLTPDISYKQLKRVSDWQLTEEAQRQAPFHGALRNAGQAFGFWLEMVPFDEGR